MTRSRLVLGMLFAGACLTVIAGLSRVPIGGAEPDEAVLRLSWRTLAVRVEECRRRTEEELAALAEHMRTPEVCTGGGADYELRVEVDQVELVRDTLVPAGARRDRPVFVFRDVDLAPGRYRVDVQFRALVPEGYEPENGGPLEYAWMGDVEVGSREIGLITLDPSGRTLVYRDR